MGAYAGEWLRVGGAGMQRLLILSGRLPVLARTRVRTPNVCHTRKGAWGDRVPGPFGLRVGALSQCSSSQYFYVCAVMQRCPVA